MRSGPGVILRRYRTGNPRCGHSTAAVVASVIAAGVAAGITTVITAGMRNTRRRCRVEPHIPLGGI